MRLNFVFALLVSVMLAGTAEAAKKSPKPAPSGPVELTEPARLQLIANRKKDIEEGVRERESWCAPANDACTISFNDYIDNRHKEVAALEQVKKYWDTGDNRKAEWWGRRYNVLNRADTEHWNALVDEFIRVNIGKEASLTPKGAKD